MNPLIENKSLSELAYGSNFAFVANEPMPFLATEYKVLQSQADSCFVKCMKTLFNGKTQIYYLTESYKPLTNVLPQLDADRFVTIIINLFADIIAVKNNGFLSCVNIDISFDKIYVDPSTFKVKLVYIPLNRKLHEDQPEFENELRTSLVKLISDMPRLGSVRTVQLSTFLSDGTISIESLYNRIKGGGATEVYTAPTSNVKTSNPNVARGGGVRIVAMNAPKHFEFNIVKDEYLIGKKSSAVDGVITFNNMVSRVHCKICKNRGQYVIVDLQSANGTYVNRKRLQPNEPCPLKSGDIIRLANSDFQVIMQ